MKQYKEMEVYDLQDLSQDNSSVSRQYKDPKYLGISVHFKKDTARRSFRLPLNGLAAYFSTADGMNYGTVKLMTLESLLKLQDPNETIVKGSVFSDFALSFAAADKRYLRTFDGTDVGGVPGMVIKTNESGYLDSSVLNIHTTTGAVGIGRWKPNSPLLVTKYFGESVVSNFYKTYTQGKSDLLIISDNSRTGEFLEDHVSPESIANLIEKELTVSIADLSKEIRVGVVSGVAGNTPGDWLGLYETENYSGFTITDQSDSPVEGKNNNSSSLVMGVNTITAGEFNIITGYDNKAFQGKGNIMTGMKNLSSSHFSFVSGISNIDRAGYGNLVLGRSNVNTRSHSSILSGKLNKVSNTLFSLVLGSKLNVKASTGSLLLGNSYTTEYSDASIISLESDESVLRSISKSVIVGEHVVQKEKGSITNSYLILSGNQVNKSTIDRVQESFLVASKLKAEASSIKTTNLLGSDINAKGDISDNNLIANSSLLDDIQRNNIITANSELITVRGITGSVEHSSVTSSTNSLIASKGVTDNATMIDKVNTSVVTTESGGKLVGASLSLVGINGGHFSGITGLMAVAVSTVLNKSDYSLLSSKDTKVTDLDSSIISTIGSSITTVQGVVGAVDRTTLSESSSSVVITKDSVISGTTSSILIGTNLDYSESNLSVIAANITKGNPRTTSASLLLGTLNIGNTRGSILVGSDIKTGNVNHSGIIGNNNETGELISSFLAGSFNTLTGSGESIYILGDTNKVNDGKWNYILGTDNTTTAWSSVVTGKRNNIKLTKSSSSVIAGDSNELESARDANNIYLLGNNNEFKGSRTNGLSQVIVGQYNKVLNSNTSNIMVGEGLVTIQDHVFDLKNVLYLGQYNDKTDKEFENLSDYLGYKIKDISMVVGAGKNDSNRHTSMIMGSTKNPNDSKLIEPFTYISGKVLSDNIMGLKSGIADSLRLYVECDITTHEKLIQPFRLLGINTRDYKSGESSEYVTYVSLATEPSKGGMVLCDPEFNDPSMVLGSSTYLERRLAKYDYKKDWKEVNYELRLVKSNTGTTVGVYSLTDLNVIRSGIVIVEETGNCKVGDYCCAQSTKSPQEAGKVRHASGSDVFNYLVVDKFTMKIKGVTRKFVRIML